MTGEGNPEEKQEIRSVATPAQAPTEPAPVAASPEPTPTPAVPPVAAEAVKPPAPPEKPVDPAWLATKAKVELVRGDIALIEADGIVNAANNDLILGGGVAAAIRRVGGPTIQEACNKIGTIPIGEAAVTTAGDLKARFVIHAASMSLGGWATEDGVRNATRNAMKRADERGMRTIAIPALGTGVAGFPMDRCARVMTRLILDHLHAASKLEKVTVVLWDDDGLATFQEAFTNTNPPVPKAERAEPPSRPRPPREGAPGGPEQGRGGRPGGGRPPGGGERRRRRGGRGRGRGGRGGGGGGGGGPSGGGPPRPPAQAK